MRLSRDMLTNHIREKRSGLPLRCTMLVVATALIVSAVASSAVAQQQSSALTVCGEPIKRSQQASSLERSEGEVSNIVQSMSKRIYSPYCPGKTLAMCPSGGAAAVRRDIQRLAREGWPVPAIESAILDACGEEYRLEEPPARDNYFLIGAVIAGLFLCLGAVWWLTRGEDDAGDADEDETALDDRDRARLDDIRREYRE